MCGDGRLVDMKAHVNGRLGGIEAGACGAYGAYGPAAAVRRLTNISFFIILHSTYYSYVRSYDI